MSKEKQLVKNTIIVAIGKICTQFISFFLLPLYTSLLSAEEYGTVDLLNTYVSLLLPLVFLQLDQAIFRFLIDARKDNEEKSKLISTTLITIVVQAILYLIVYCLFGRFINNKYKYFLVTNVIASMFSTILLQISRGLGDNTTYSIGSLVSGAGTVILNVLFIVVFKWGAYGMLTATFLANIFCAIFVFIRIRLYRYLRIKKYNKGIIKDLLKYSIPLIPNQLSWWIINVSDRSIITYFLGIGNNGIYSVANKFSGICVSFFGIFNMTWAESASMYIKDEDSSVYFSNIVNKSIKLFISLCLGIVAFMPLVFNILITGEEYSSAYYQIPILMISTIFNIIVSLLSSIYIALKKSKEIAKTTIYSAIINIGINLIFIRVIGLYAASISTLIAYLSMSVYRYLDVQKYLRIKIDKKMIFISLIVSVVIIIIYYIRNNMLCILGAGTSVIFAYIYNKDILIDGIRIVRTKIKNYRVKDKEII